MVDGLGVQALDKAHFIGDRLQVREEIADPESVLTAELSVLERRRAGVATLTAGHARESLGAFDRRRQIFACHLLEHRLVVKEVDVRQAARLK